MLIVLQLKAPIGALYVTMRQYVCVSLIGNEDKGPIQIVKVRKLLDISILISFTHISKYTY